MKQLLLRLALLSVSIAALPACDPQTMTTATNDVAVESELLVIRMQPLAEQYTTSGTLITDDRIDIASRLMGFIHRIDVDEGGKVIKGQKLLTIDPTDILSQQTEAQARVTQAQARYNEAVRDHQRFKALYEQKLIAVNRFRKAELDLQLAEEELRAAEANLERIHLQLQYAEIRSPVDGVIVARHKQAGDIATPGAALLTIENPNTLVVKTFIKEHHIAQINVGTQAEVFIDAAQLATTATVSKIIPAADPTTHSYLVKLTLADNSQLRSGMFARVNFAVGHRRGIAIPQTALIRRFDMTGVYIVDEQQIAHYRLVRTGRRFDDQIEIVAGLKPNDRIALGNHGKLKTGVPVVAVTTGDPASPDSQ